MPSLLASSQKCAHDATVVIRSIKVPNTTVQLLTQTAKMPGPSWSLPAHKACPRANGTICDSCYAAKGCYVYRSTRNAQAVRFAWTVASLRTADARQQWVAALVAAIRAVGCAYFRVHDSGDLFSAQYASCWHEVCRQLPDVRFWVPTPSGHHPAGPLPVFDPLLGVLRKLAVLPNVTVRPSALNFGDNAPTVDGL